MRRLFKNATMITMVPGEEIRTDVSMLVEGDTIVSIGETIQDEANYDEVIDVRGN